jgi:inosine/xanthosine triphosphatase
MRIAIGTLNDAKNNAVENIIKSIWSDAEFYRIETNSMVSAQPKSDEEAIKGAINRAKQALTKNNVDYGIGLEGTVNTNRYGMFLHGWVAIIDREHNIGLGQSGSIQLPKNIEYRINNGEELGPIMQELMKDDDNKIRHNEGTNGILSNGLYTRVKEFEDATRCALAKFVNKELYIDNAF